MAISVSAVANRSALHPDYYTGKKITVTPLNFVCKRRRPPPRAQRPAHMAVPSRRKISGLRIFSINFPHGAKMPMKYGFT
jgi:hypothetical protein